MGKCYWDLPVEQREQVTTMSCFDSQLQDVVLRNWQYLPILIRELAFLRKSSIVMSSSQVAKHKCFQTLNDMSACCIHLI